jgi:hypothetical protein
MRAHAKKGRRLTRFRATLSLVLACLALAPAIASAQTLRVATYNIDADTGGAVGHMGGPDAGPGLATVLQAIGNEPLNGHAQPIDVLALEELNGTPTTTLNYIVGQLNNIYGAGTYAYHTTTDPTDGNNLTGNGPSGLIYNTKTVQDLGAVAIGTPSGSGPPSRSNALPATAGGRSRGELLPVREPHEVGDEWSGADEGSGRGRAGAGLEPAHPVAA